MRRARRRRARTELVGLGPAAHGRASALLPALLLDRHPASTVHHPLSPRALSRTLVSLQRIACASHTTRSTPSSGSVHLRRAHPHHACRRLRRPAASRAQRLLRRAGRVLLLAPALSARRWLCFQHASSCAVAEQHGLFSAACCRCGVALPHSRRCRASAPACSDGKPRRGSGEPLRRHAHLRAGCGAGGVGRLD